MSHRYAIVQDNVIVNIIVADENFITEFYPDAILCQANVGVGDGYADGQFFSNSNTITEIVDDLETE